MRGLGRRVPTALAYGAIAGAAVFGPWPTFVVLTLALFAIGVLELTGLYARERPIIRRLAVVLGAIYLAVGLGSLVVLWGAWGAYAHHAVPDVLAARGITALPGWLLLAVLPAWAADIAAYAVGSLVGRRPLVPGLSPGKTWEGTIGGFAAAALAAFGVGAWLGLPRLPVTLAVIGIGPVALAGDLAESWVKRRVGAKDSGTLLPGHGGVLDRIDSLLLVAPFVVLLLALADATSRDAFL